METSIEDNLESWREQIQRIDEETLILIKRRFNTVKKITEIKKKANIQVNEANLNTQKLNKLLEKAKDMGLQKEFTQELFNVIMTESKKIEEKNS